MNDMFPETLLVTNKDGRIYTDSLRVAEHFHKRHDNLVGYIEKVISQSPEHVRLLNFKERNEVWGCCQKGARYD